MELTERIKQYLSVTGDGARVAQLRDSLAEPGPAIMAALADLGEDVLFADDGRWYLVNPYTPSPAAVAYFNEPESIEPEPVIEPEPQPEPVVGKPETFDRLVAELAEIAEELKAELPVVVAPIVEEPAIPAPLLPNFSVYEMADKLIQKYGSGKYPGMRKNPSKPVENPVMTAFKKAVGVDKKPITPASHILSLEMWQVLREWLMHTYSDPDLTGAIQWPLTPAQITDRRWRGKTVRSQVRDTIRAIRGMNRWGNNDDRELLKATIANLDNVLEQPAASSAPVKEVKPVKSVKATKVAKDKAASNLIKLIEMTPDDVVVEDAVVDAEFNPTATLSESLIKDDINTLRHRLVNYYDVDTIKTDVWKSVCLGIDSILEDIGMATGTALRSELRAMAEFFDVARAA